MKKDAKHFDGGRPFRLAHQTLCITAFNFETESLIGYVEMLIHPLKPDLRRVKINSKQCRIYRVALNEVWETNFAYNDPTLEICQGDSKQRNLDHFENAHLSGMLAVDSDHGNGELTVKMPPEASTIISEMKPFRICIEFSLERPQGGVKFVVPDMDGTMLDRGAHLFTYGHENSSRLWFPCIDSYSAVCTWKLEYTVDMYMTAVSCGDVIETVYTVDLRKKTYHYYMSTPTAAPNIALAVGPFEVYVDPHMHEVTHFCLPHLLPVLKHATSHLHEAFEFYEELLSSRYPYSCYKQVFVDMAYQDKMSYATISIFSTNLLHPRRIIDQCPVSRQVMAHAVAEQFFGCFISIHSWFDAWLPKGIAGYLSSLYTRRAFGNNEYRHFVAQEMKEVTDYEQKVGVIVLDPLAARETGTYFPCRHPHTVSPHYASVFQKKSHLIIRMLDIRIGQELLLQVLNKLLSLAVSASQQKVTSNTWPNMLLSTASFLKSIFTVTGKDVQTFMEQWVAVLFAGVPAEYRVYTQVSTLCHGAISRTSQLGGHVQFNGSFVFNRKRNVLELELKQDFMSKGAMKYAGPLTVAIQELDGTFNHNFKIEENKTKFEITCHSKSRRQKKKKIPLCIGEEVDMDLVDTDADTPVLWLRIDPDMTILRTVKLEQPDWMWQYMLRYERCVCAQSAAITALEGFPTPKTRLALTDTLEQEKCYFRVRIEAANVLARVANTMVVNWAGPPAMMTIFRKMFGSHSCTSIVRQNNFSNFQHYYLQKAIPVAMANLRTMHGICPQEVLQFLLDLFKYNDNSKNKYSDNYYRASLIDALSATVTPAVTTVTVTGFGPSTDALTADSKLILEEITRCLNLEKLLPCYKHTTTVSCLKAIRWLQKYGHLPSDCTIFKSYACHGNFVDVRLAALHALVDYTKVESNLETLTYLLQMVEEDPECYVRHRILRMLIENPPFNKKDPSPLSTEALVEKLWNLMNSGFAHDSRLRCDVVDLYYTLYGRTRPTCLPIPDGGENSNDRRRQADTELDTAPIERSSSVDSSLKVEPSEDSEFKVRVTMCSLSPVETVKLEGRISPVAAPKTPPPLTPLHGEHKPITFTDEFMKFSGITEEVVATTSPVVSPTPQMSVISETVSVTTHHDPPMTHRPLSEESGSNSLPGLLPKSESTSHMPTSFDSSMFVSQRAAAESPTISIPPPPKLEEEQHKPHKAKKKKKKNKHKHKHKHRDDKKERSEKPRDKPLVGISTIVDPLSSGASLTNSPMPQRPLSSPEFEVI